MTSPKVSLLTFNVFLRPPPIKTNEDDYKQERFEEILKVIREYDIVCLQEMFQTGTFRSQKIIEFAIANKFYYWKMGDPPSFAPGPVVDSGLMVLSKFPILSSEFMSYGVGILSDSASDKGYIYCKIEVRGKVLHLFSTHLQASYMEAGKELQRELSVRVRLRQAEVLTERIEALLTKNQYKNTELVMLVGDMNINSNEKPFKLTANSHLGSYREGKKTVRQPLHEKGEDYFSEYEAFQRIFAERHMVLIDHIFERYREHKVTFGDNETVLTGESEAQSCQRLDYIFTLVPAALVAKVEQSCLRAKTSSCSVQQFKRPLEKYGQLSDHYGISICIQPK